MYQGQISTFLNKLLICFSEHLLHYSSNKVESSSRETVVEKVTEPVTEPVYDVCKQTK